jgi:homoserine kinase
VSLKANEPAAENAVVVPGSVANLGGGFDTLGVAVQLYLRARIVDVRNDGGTRLVVTSSTPPVRGRNALERAFRAVAALTGQPAPSVFVEVFSDIPMAAGLGSSAAASVAGLRIFEHVTAPLPEGVLLAAAASIEGHADNAAPALFGGLTSVLEPERGDPVALRWVWPDDLQLVVATPHVGLSTAKARAALPELLSRKDAVFNLQRVVALVHALHTRQYDHLREAVKDRWHQPARAALVPALREVLALEDPDVLGAFLSGAGPSVAAIVRRDTARIVELMQSLYASVQCPATVRVLRVHHGASTSRGTLPEKRGDAVASAHGRTV